MKNIDIKQSAMGGVDLFSLHLSGLSFHLDVVNPESPKLTIWFEKEDLQKVVAFGNAVLEDADRGK